MWFAALAVGGGCATAPPVSAPPVSRTAQLELVNLSESEWRVAVATPDGRVARTLPIAARATLRAEFPGGTYQITQTALTAVAGPGATREFSLRLEPGETYRWRLATLLATPTDDRP